MNYRMLQAGDRIEPNDEYLYDNTFWDKCHETGHLVPNGFTGRYRRPITDTCIPSFRHMYSASGVTITVDETADIKKAAAFLGAIAMMLDGQAEA